MVSQFGSLGYTIMGKTADLTVVQKTIIDTLHKEGKPETLIIKEAGCSQSAVSKHVNRKLSGRKKCGRKSCPTNRENCSLMRIVKQNRFKILVNFIRNGLRLGSRHQEPPHTDVSRNLATVVVRGVCRKGGEAHSPICLKSSVKCPQSVMIWGAMSSAGVGPLFFLKTNVTAPNTRNFGALSCFLLLFKDADLIFQQDWHPAHTAKSTKSWF